MKTIDEDLVSIVSWLRPFKGGHGWRPKYLFGYKYVYLLLQL